MHSIMCGIPFAHVSKYVHTHTKRTYTQKEHTHSIVIVSKFITRTEVLMLYLLSESKRGLD
jgi:hypothetical protein